MLEEKYRRLINHKIDGVLAQQESQELDEYLQKNPEERKYLEDLILLTQSLQEVPKVEPPANLKKRIIGSIIVASYPARQRSGLLGSLDKMFASRRKLQFAYAFSAGLVAGVVGLAVVWQSFNHPISWDWSQLYGAILSKVPDWKFTTLDQVEFKHGDLKGSAVTRSADEFDEIIVAELDLRPPSQARMIIRFKEKDFDFYGWGGLKHRLNSVSVTSGQIEFQGQDRIHYLLMFKNSSGVFSPLSLQVYCGELRLEQDLITQETRKSENN